MQSGWRIQFLTKQVKFFKGNLNTLVLEIVYIPYKFMWAEKLFLKRILQSEIIAIMYCNNNNNNNNNDNNNDYHYYHYYYNELMMHL